jgi:hypothetical protein
MGESGAKLGGRTGVPAFFGFVSQLAVFEGAGGGSGAISGPAAGASGGAETGSWSGWWEG